MLPCGSASPLTSRTDEQAGERDRDELADSCESKESLRSALRQSRRNIAREK
jgi:hypothetical protein